MRNIKLNLLIIQAICLGVFLIPTSCKMNEKEDVAPKVSAKIPAGTTGNSSTCIVHPALDSNGNCSFTTQSFDFFGGQTIYTGTINVTNDETNLYVTYHTTGGWVIEQTHLYVGTLEGLPINKSNTPVPGHFPYKDTFSPYVTEYTYSIPLSGLPDCYIIAAHAEVHKIENGQIVDSQTAWSNGTPFPGTNRWGWYSNYCTQKCDGGGSGSSGSDGRDG